MRTELLYDEFPERDDDDLFIGHAPDNIYGHLTPRQALALRTKLGLLSVADGVDFIPGIGYPPAIELTRRDKSVPTLEDYSATSLTADRYVRGHYNRLRRDLAPFVEMYGISPLNKPEGIEAIEIAQQHINSTRRLAPSLQGKTITILKTLGKNTG